MVINSHNHSDYSEKMQRCHDYIHALEEERKKIQVFQRELPLCLELITQAIEACRQQLSGTTTEYNFHGGQSECSEQTSSEGPVLEEFIPIKRTSSSDNEEEQQSRKQKHHNPSKSVSEDKGSKKSDWLRSVQLWNQPDPPSKEDSPRKASVSEVKRNGSGGAFHPFKKDKSAGTSSDGANTTQAPTSRPVLAAAASSTAATSGTSGGGGGGGCKKEDNKEGQSQRKSRRCWSPELHRRFLQALQQLGGSHVATPKQIRELMKVEGLTNDEVKSHLQKYRLHTRRPNNPPIHTTNSPQTPQFVVVGGIWMPPPPEYAAAMATPNASSGEASGGAGSNGIYAPVATLPPSIQASSSLKQRKQHKQDLHSDDQGSHSEGGIHSNSPATSSSTHTSTASPAY